MAPSQPIPELNRLQHVGMSTEVHGAFTGLSRSFDHPSATEVHGAFTGLLHSFDHPSDGYFSKVSRLFKDHYWLLAFKWTEIFTHDVISSVPVEWHRFLDHLSSDHLKRMMVEMSVDNVPRSCPQSFKLFIDGCRELAIRLNWPSFDVHVDPGTREHRTSEKKVSEVKHVAEFIDSLLRETNEKELPVIIDIGCGLGYLTKKLSSKGFKLIGIDARGDLCVRATSSKKNSSKKETPSKESSKDSSRFVEMFIEDTDECLSSILNLIPPDREAVLIGLHSCGDLLKHIISLYSKSPRFVGMFCVTCCYHKIDKSHFPRSSVFREAAEEEKVIFNPVILRVGTQRTPLSWSHELSDSSLDAHTKSAAFRGILQEVVESKPFVWKKQRSKMKLQNEFSGYIDQVILGFEEEERSQVLSLLERQAEKRSAHSGLVRSLKILQTLIQPVVESAVVYDHVKHLNELGLESWAVQSFSQIISPRNLLVISMKDFSGKYP